MSESQPDYSKLTEDQLNELFAEGKGFLSDDPAPPAAEPAKPAEGESEKPPEAAEPEKSVEAAPAETAAEPAAEEADTAADPQSLETEGERVKREKLEAALELQRAHASRLAGEIGYLRKQLESIPRSSEPYEPQSKEELDRVTQLESRLQELEGRRIQAEVTQAVNSAIQSLDVAEVVGPIQAELAIVAQNYREQIEEARKVSDPELARQLAVAIGRSVIADAKELAWTNRRKSLEEKRAEQQAALATRKKAAAVSGGSTAASPRPAPKTYDQMTPAELDLEMEKEFGRR